MRISTANSYATTVGSLQKRNEELSRAQEQMSSGLRISKPSDDPAGVSRAERARVEVSRSQALLRTVEASRAMMTQGESALGDAVDLIHNARDALVAAGNGSYSASDRRTLAEQLKQLRGQLLSVANQQDGSGHHLFGGQGATTRPFLDSTTGVDWWQGSATAAAFSDGQINGSMQETLPLTVDGLQAWMRAGPANGTFTTTVGTANQGGGVIDAGTVTSASSFNANAAPYKIAFSGSPLNYQITDASNAAVASGAYTPGAAITGIPGISFSVSGTPAVGDHFSIKTRQSVFDALDKAISVLNNPGATSSQIAQAVSTGIGELDRSTDQLQWSRSIAGETLNQMDGLDGRTQDRIVASETARSTAEDIDMVQAVSDFTNKQTTYQAALQSYAMVQKLSLFNYIGN